MRKELWIPLSAGLFLFGVAIPNEVFYANRHEGRHLVRFAFCKRPEVLDEAAERLAKLATG